MHNLKRSPHHYIFALALLLLSCNESEDTIPISSVGNFIVQDNGNTGNGSDIEINFQQPQPTDKLKEYRVIAVKAINAADFTIGDANSLPKGRYESEDPVRVNPLNGITLNTESLDVNGDLISSGETYVFGVLAVPKDRDSFSNSLRMSTKEFTLSLNNLVSDHSSEFGGASSLAIDDNGNIFMSFYDIVWHLLGSPAPHRDKSDIYQVKSNGQVSIFSSPNRNLLSGNAIDKNGNLYQSALFSGDILKVNGDGTSTTVEHNGVNLAQADGIFVDNNENMFVADPSQGRIIKITPEGVSSVYAEVGKEARGITGDDTGNLYVSHNREDGQITKISPDGDVSKLANVPTFIPERYTIEYIMWVGYLVYHDGFLYVAGLGTDQIHKVSLDGKVEVFAGSGTRGRPRGGVLTATFNRPMGLVFSEDGKTLFVSGCTDNVPQHTQASTPAKIWKIQINEE